MSFYFQPFIHWHKNFLNYNVTQFERNWMAFWGWKREREKYLCRLLFALKMPGRVFYFSLENIFFVWWWIWFRVLVCVRRQISNEGFLRSVCILHWNTFGLDNPLYEVAWCTWQNVCFSTSRLSTAKSLFMKYSQFHFRAARKKNEQEQQQTEGWAEMKIKAFFHKSYAEEMMTQGICHVWKFASRYIKTNSGMLASAKKTSQIFKSLSAWLLQFSPQFAVNYRSM